MFKWLLTMVRKPEPQREPEPPTLRKRVERLEIDLEEAVSKLEAVWARQRKVEGAVHGMRGANARHPSRLDQVEETLEQYRDRMAAEGRLPVARGADSNGDH